MSIFFFLFFISEKTIRYILLIKYFNLYTDMSINI